MNGYARARSHARSGDSVALAAYLGGSDRFDRALTELVPSASFRKLPHLHDAQAQ